MPNTANIVLNIFIEMIPINILRYCIFMDKLKIKKSQLLCLYFLIFAVDAGILIWFQSSTNVVFRSVQYFKLALIVFNSVIPFLLIKENFFKQLFLYCFSIFYFSNINRISNHIDARYLSDSIRDMTLGTNNAVKLAVLAVSMPLVWQFYRKTVKNAIGYIELTIWRIVWIIPALFFAISLFDALSFSPDYIASTHYFIMSIFFLVSAVACCYILFKIFWQATENATVKENARMTEQQLNLQGEQYEMFADNITKSRIERHDMRHQLAALKGYLNKSDVIGASKYCDELNKSIPINYEREICENFAVNALALHYLTIAESEDISVELLLVIPIKIDDISDKDFCIILGNLFENAIEACRRMTNGERFIKLNSSIKSDYLLIGMDNSFDGTYKLEGSTYFSQKRDGVGIGLSSVKSVVEKYSGSVNFQANGNVFLSSAMLRINDTK